ncbi:MAG: AMP-binding protein [Oligoflexia bacterium]|nr:AMP-binding protein [Oligoflexia bacterium]
MSNAIQSYGQDVLNENYFNLSKLFKLNGDYIAILRGDKGNNNNNNNKMEISFSKWSTELVKILNELNKKQIIPTKTDTTKRYLCGIYSDNNCEALNAILILWKLNIVPFFIPKTYPKSKVIDVLKKYSIELLISDTEFNLNNSNSNEELSKRVKVISTGMFRFRTSKLNNVNNVNNEIEIEIEIEIEEMNIPLENEAFVMFSGGGGSRGGEGRKPVVHTFKSMLMSAIGTIRFYKMEKGDSCLLSLPLYHVGGLMIFIRSILNGCKLIIPTRTSNSTLDLENAIHQHSPDFISLVATQFIRLIVIERLSYQFSKMKAIIIGGGPTPGWPIKLAKEKNYPVSLTYGSTEMCSQVTATSCMTADDFLLNHSSCHSNGHYSSSLISAGKVLDFRQLKVNEDKEIYLRGETLFKGYLTEEGEVTAPVSLLDIDVDVKEIEWFASGDLGFIDENGELHLIGRKDNIFISGGEKIDPQEIENHIKEITWVADAIVVSVPHKEFGEVPWCFIESIKKIPIKKVINFLKERIPSYMIPKGIIFLEENNNFKEIKYDRKALKEYAMKLFNDFK